MGQERLTDAAKSVAQSAAKQGVAVRWESYKQMPHTWPFLFPELWQSRRCLTSWAEAIELFGMGEKVENKGTCFDIEGKTTELDVKSLLNMTVDEVEQCMREKTASLKDWTGMSRTKEKL